MFAIVTYNVTVCNYYLRIHEVIKWQICEKKKSNLIFLLSTNLLTLTDCVISITANYFYFVRFLLLIFFAYTVNY